MKAEEKILYFEYTLKKLLDWHSNASGHQENDISVLKSLKLLFFVSAASAIHSKSKLLKDVFCFVAMPYGHVESQVYDIIREKRGKLNYFEINNQRTIRNLSSNLEDLDKNLNTEYTIEIDLSISYLQKENHSLILMPAFDLVNLSHAWYSWQTNYNKAQQGSVRSYLIPSEEIEKEDKIFSLEIF